MKVVKISGVFEVECKIWIFLFVRYFFLLYIIVCYIFVCYIFLFVRYFYFPSAPAFLADRRVTNLRQSLWRESGNSNRRSSAGVDSGDQLFD